MAQDSCDDLIAEQIIADQRETVAAMREQLEAMEEGLRSMSDMTSGSQEGMDRIAQEFAERQAEVEAYRAQVVEAEADLEEMEASYEDAHADCDASDGGDPGWDPSQGLEKYADAGAADPSASTGGFDGAQASIDGSSFPSGFDFDSFRSSTSDLFTNAGNAFDPIINWFTDFSLQTAQFFAQAGQASEFFGVMMENLFTNSDVFMHLAVNIASTAMGTGPII